MVYTETLVKAIQAATQALETLPDNEYRSKAEKSLTRVLGLASQNLANLIQIDASENKTNGKSNCQIYFLAPTASNRMLHSDDCMYIALYITRDRYGLPLTRHLFSQARVFKIQFTPTPYPWPSVQQILTDLVEEVMEFPEDGHEYLQPVKAASKNGVAIEQIRYVPFHYKMVDKYDSPTVKISGVFYSGPCNNVPLDARPVNPY